jgi:hypothetical protein
MIAVRDHSFEEMQTSSSEEQVDEVTQGIWSALCKVDAIKQKGSLILGSHDQLYKRNI